MGLGPGRGEEEPVWSLVGVVVGVVVEVVVGVVVEVVVGVVGELS